MRLVLFVVCLTGCSSSPTAPVITKVTYSPMQLVVNVQATVSGQASFRDPDGDTHQIVLGFVDPIGALSETAPYDTGTSGRLTAEVPFSLTLTPTQTGTYQLSVRFIDDTGLSTSTTEPLEVQ